ncbi:unnamed protein product [Paramecium octaurelia]|uniref:RING-type domain-containing protein n=1 Tax=Paramecium octaurelia TaxID=43137 RepID=A0A8S1T1D7_PAROT|nr:unnamed protein product [Paramecium octaurelia]
MNPHQELQQFQTKIDESQVMVEYKIQKHQNQIECHCCKKIISSKFKKVNTLHICFNCLDQISVLRVKYDLSTQYKLFQSPIHNYYCKLTMTPTSQFDFTFSLCQICYQTKMLIKACNLNHFFCETCISSYIQNNFDITVKCLQYDCNVNINYQLMFLYLESPQLIKWIPITKQIHCIGQRCSGVWSVWPNYIQGNVEIISLNQCKCQLCHIQFCFKCRTVHTGLECSNEILQKNYIQEHKCFRCYCCNSLCQPHFCYINEASKKFKEWKSNIYECYVCKKQFCYDCKAETNITLFSEHKCDNCVIKYREMRKKLMQVPKFKKIIQLLFATLILVLYSIYSMIFIQIPQILDYFVNKIDPICESQDPLKIILLIVNLPLIIILFFTIYAVTLIPLAIYNSFQAFIAKQKIIDNDI